MLIYHRSALLLAIAFSLAIGSISFARAPLRSKSNAPEIMPGVIYVKFKPQPTSGVQTSSAYASVAQKYSVLQASQPFLRVARKPSEEEFTRIFKFIIPQSIDVMNVVKELRNDPNIEYAEPSYIRHTTGYTPNDPSFAAQWNLAKIDASAAWNVTKGDSTVVIGIVDSGTDYTHEDLAANIWTNPGETGLDAQGHDKRTNGIDDDGNGFVDDWHGWDFQGATATTTPDNDPSPKNGNPHGTHTAGTASAVTDNSVGIASIGFKCKLMITKHGIDSGGETATSLYNTFDGVLYCINNGANIVSCSWGGGGYSQYEQDVVRYGLEKNVLVVAAAGNGGDDGIGDDNGVVANYPSNYHGVLAVGATDTNDKIASFSNYGTPDYVQVFSPGVNILSTVPNNGYQSDWSGTSMATPLVSGLAGLVKSAHPTWSASQILFQICGTADNIDALNPSSFAGKLGYGRINAARALTETPPPPLPDLVLGSITVDDASGGNGNGILEPGESAHIIISVQNNWGDASNVTATLSTNHWAVSLTKSTSSYGLVRGLDVVDSSVVSNASDPFAISISSDAVPSVIPFTLTYSTPGGYTKQFSFSLSIAPSILLVDDDDGTVNVEGSYISPLQALGAGYDVWDHSKSGTPPAAVLSKYGTVIWFCEWAFPSLDSTDRSSITSYLNGGGKIFLSGQDIGWDLSDPTGDEFSASGGTSKTFMENVLKAHYVADNAGTTNVVGVANDSIGNGISFTEYLAERQASEQFPDVTQPTNGSVSAFNYGDGAYAGQSAAIRYNGGYKVVYFSFGGLEAIADSSKRVLILNQILRWLGGYTAVVDKLKDTEDISDPVPVSATITSSSPIQSATLYYDTDGGPPFKKVAMTLGSGKYTGYIPALGMTADVQYFVLIKTAAGYLPYTINSFHVGPDIIPPQIFIHEPLKNTLTLKGPFTIVANITDNIAVDTNSIVFHYTINGSGESTGKFLGNGSANTYQLTFDFPTTLTPGDIVNYYITAQDQAIMKNTARFPSTGVDTVMIGRETVDDFEDSTLVLWDYGMWGYSQKFHHSPGLLDITDSPYGAYLPNTNNILRRLKSFDLSPYAQMKLTYYYKSIIDPSDTLFVEVSKDGSTWVPIRKLNGIKVVGPLLVDTLDLGGFVGAGNTNIQLRFRLLADAVNQSDGFYLDDVQLIGSDTPATVRQPSIVIPEVYSMGQNFPNPFNPSTMIRIGLPEASRVDLRIFDAVGRQVALLVNDRLPAGTFDYQWNAGDMASGVYFCRIVASSSSSNRTFTQVNKLLLIK
ncbi:MAG TPA: S8 family serine peptidase [Bacteroidota bacterium]|nr:S8 family serine peptidase [Bacteroidota bacterium]